MRDEISLAVGAVTSRVVSAYSACGALAFVYGQGSVFCGFSLDSDLDVVMVWDGAVPLPAAHPAGQLCDPDFEPTQVHEAGYALDKLLVSGWELDVSHYSRRQFDAWCAAVGAGDGWQQHAWPLPLHAVAGFVYGTDLHDPGGEAATVRSAIRTPRAELAGKAMKVLGDEFPGYAELLDKAAARGEGWLFHHLAGQLIKHCYIAWFAVEGCYLPFPKRLDQWAERLGLDPRLTELDRRVWAGPDLEARRTVVVEFAERVLGMTAGLADT